MNIYLFLIKNIFVIFEISLDFF